MSPISKKIVRLKAELIAGNEKYDGIIESFTEDSINFLTGVSAQGGLNPDVPLEIRFQNCHGDEMSLQCILKWKFKTPPHGLTNSLGMKIRDLPADYEEFYKTLG